MLSWAATGEPNASKSMYPAIVCTKKNPLGNSFMIFMTAHPTFGRYKNRLSNDFMMFMTAYSASVVAEVGPRSQSHSVKI
jgi:hypothetical protein